MSVRRTNSLSLQFCQPKKSAPIVFEKDLRQLVCRGRRRIVHATAGADAPEMELRNGEFLSATSFYARSVEKLFNEKAKLDEMDGL